MTIPLVDDESKNSINTSVIAIKKEIEQINSLLQNLNNKLKSLSDNDFLYRSDLTDTVTVGDNQPVTSNGVAGAIELGSPIVKYTENNDANLCIPKEFHTKSYLLGSSASNIPQSTACLIVSSLQSYSNSNWKSLVQICYCNSTSAISDKLYYRTAYKSGSEASWVFGEWKLITVQDSSVNITPNTGVTINNNNSCKIGDMIFVNIRFQKLSSVTSGTDFYIGKVNYAPKANMGYVGFYGQNLIAYYINTSGEIYGRPYFNSSVIDGPVSFNFQI